MKVFILDLGINNLTSVLKSYSESLDKNDSIATLEKYETNLRPDLIVLPGLGTFAAGMGQLSRRGLDEALYFWLEKGSKLVGICLGLQLLGESSEESEGKSGLSLIEGHSRKLQKVPSERVPNVGWVEVNGTKLSNKFESLTKKNDFYFVHSYHFCPADEANILAEAEYGDMKIVAGVHNENVLGFQFHPEKSGQNGLNLTREIIAWARNEN
jgi:glutamine amidotransferase